jgi:DNA-nicking Smr family endonuclease
VSSARLDELADIEDANKLREKARHYGREMSEAYDQARIVQSMGYREVAQGHRQKADAYKSSMEELNKRAAKIIFREKNKNRTEGEIDFHGLFVAEAVEFAKEVLRSARLRGVIVVRFIVGKGLHTVDGVAKIRPALEDLCTERGLNHSLDPTNAGVLIVRLV